MALFVGELPHESAQPGVRRHSQHLGGRLRGRGANAGAHPLGSTDGKRGSHITEWAGAGKVDTNLFHGTLDQLAAAISRDDLPYSETEFLNLIQQGVAAELRTGAGASGVTAVQGALAAVHARDAADVIAQQVTQLQNLIQNALPGSPGRASGDTGTSSAPASP